MQSATRSVLAGSSPQRTWRRATHQQQAHAYRLEHFDSAMVEIVEGGYRALAKKFHPDAGGDVGKTQEVNAAHGTAPRKMRTEESIKRVWKKLFGIDVEIVRQHSNMIPEAIKPIAAHLEFLKKLEGPRGNEALEQKGARHDANQRTVDISYQQKEFNSNKNRKGGDHMKVSQAFPSNFIKVDDLQ